MIELFRGNNFFLSNMKPLKNWIPTDQGILVPTAEHAYQAAKFLDPTIHKLVAAARFYDAPNKPVYADGYMAKELARAFIETGVEVYPDFEISKRTIMLSIVAMKFERNADLAERLLATGDEELVEGNTWGDRYWGIDPVGSRNGDNNLGKILMEVRDRLRATS